MKYNTEYWQKYYETATRQEPSDFAKFCIDRMEGRVLDVCCGDGRDSYFFAEKFSVSAIDLVPIDAPFFTKVDLRDKSEIRTPFGFDNVYCRFVLHAVPEDIEDHILIQSNKALKVGGQLFIETRSDLGTHDGTHYRRLTNLDSLLNKLSNLNFEITYLEESDGLSVHHDDPVLIRIIAKKLGEIKVRSDMTFDEYHKDIGVLDKKACKHLLFSTKKVLGDIRFLLCFGTLLGAYRDKDFIEYDEDVDIAVFAEDKPAVDKLIEDGYFKVYGLEFIRDNPVCYSFVYDNNYIDFYFFLDKRGSFMCGGGMRIQRWQILDGFTTINFLGEDFQTVNNIEQYLTEKYGKWKQRIKNQHAIT